MNNGVESPLIVMGCDERYCFPLAVALFSAQRATKVPLRAVILSDRIGPIGQASLHRVAKSAGVGSLQIIDVDVQQFSQHVTGLAYLSVAAFSRLLIPSLLPSEGCCIWIDSDVLVNRDLAELWNADLAGRPIAAVQCYHTPTVAVADAIPYFPPAAAQPSLPYFNSGVMLIDLQAWRAERIDEKMSAFLSQYGKVLNAADQDVLNALFLDRWQRLPGYWNDQEAANRKAGGAQSERHIRHFSGPQKPWNSGLLDVDCRQWLRCARESAYYSPLRFWPWRLHRFLKVLLGTGTNWVQARGWKR